MSARVTQLSYNAGVLSGLMEGRADDSKYQAGLAVCRNAVCTPQGPVQNRAGFMYVNETKYPDKPTRLIPFNYSADQTMIIELGDKYARFHAQGKTLMRVDDPTTPYEIETPWAAEDIMAVHYTQNAALMTLTHVDYPPQEIRRYSLTDWRCATVSLVATLAPPTGVNATVASQAANDDNASKYTQHYVITALNADRTEESQRSADASVVANLYATGTTVRVSWNVVSGAEYYRVYKLQGGIYGYIGETSGTEIIDDNIAPETGVTPPYTDDIFGMSGGITSVEVTNGGSGYGSKFNVVGAKRTGVTVTEHYYLGDGYKTETRVIDLPDTKDTFPWLGAMTGIVETTTAGTGEKAQVGLVYQTTHPSGGWNPYRARLVDAKTVRIGPGYTGDVKFYRRAYAGSRGTTWREITMDAITEPILPEVYVTDPTGYGALLEPLVTDGVIVGIRIINGGFNYTNPKVVINGTASGGSGAAATATVGTSYDYPATVGHFEQRRVFAGTRLRPQQIWMTATGTENNMTYHLPLQDDDRISFAVASRDLNQVRHVVPLQQLIMLTSSGEWRVSPLNSDAITPTSISVRQQAYTGASDVQPVIANNTAIYAASRGGHVHEIAYNYQAGGYITGDLSLRATNLFDNLEIRDLAYSKAPFSVVWAVSSSGGLLGLTYVPEQSVGAWFEYTTDGQFMSTAVVQEGTEDALYAVVQRNVNGVTKQFIERQGARSDGGPGEGLYLDCAGLYVGDLTTTVSGLSWLAGATVTVNADGVVYEGVKVSEQGTIELPKSASRVTVGLPYSMELQTMPVIFGLSDGSLGKGRAKNINRVWIRVRSAAAPEVGPSFEAMTQQKTRTKEAPGDPPDLIDGVVEVVSPGAWETDASVCIRLSKPLPFTLVSHSAEVAVGG